MKKTLLFMIAMMFSVATFAQVTTSGISGKVTDEKAEVLVGATVIALHTPSGTEYGAATNIDGRYTIQGMRTGGPYTITVSYVGYTTIEATDVMLKLGEVTTMDFELKEGVNLEEIQVVSTAGSRFNNSKTGAAMNFNTASIESTPTVSRSVYDVAALSPQVSTYDGGISFAGANNRYNSFQIDGAMANDVFGLADAGINGGSTGSNAVSLDAIEELQVVVAPFDVRQSGFTGGGINAVTKSGTNTFKATAYTYFNNENFYGTTAGEIAEGKKREKATEQTSQIYGFTAGGAIIKDKLFAFVSVEKNKDVTPVDYYPGMSDEYVSEATIKTILDQYYAKTKIKDTYSKSAPSVGRESLDILARFDYNINQKHKLMFRYQYKDAFDDAYYASFSTYNFDGSSYSYNNKTHSFVAELNSRFSNTVSNEARVTFTSVRDFRGLDYLGPRVTIYDVDFGVDNSGDDITGTVNIGTEAYSGANKVNQDVYTISDNVSIFKGSHTITAGTHSEIYKIGNTFISNATGSYVYNNMDDFLNDQADSYKLTYAVNCDNQEYMPIMHAGQFGFYVQDEWKPNSNFTLTAGLRADIAAIFNEPPVNEDFNKSSLSNNGEHMVGRSPKTQVLWSPRVGFRYYFNDEHSQLLRGGAGIFTGRVPFVWMHNAFSNNGVDKKSVTVYNNIPELSNDLSKDGIVGKETINIVSKNFKYPQVFRANLAYEHNFDNGWKATIEGLYTKNINDVTFRNVALSDKGNKLFTVSADAANDQNTAVYYNMDAGDYYAVINLENTNKGYSYNFSAMVEKSFDFGLNLMASYSYGNAYSVNGGTSSQAVSNWRYNYTVNSNQNELGLSTYSTPHKISAAINYVSPKYAKGRLNTVIGLTYNGSAGYRYGYSYNDVKDINGDGAYGSKYGNTLLYIPTEDEIGLMDWDTPESEASFRKWVNSDDYASSHRGQFSERNGVVSPMEHHINLHIAENFIYNQQRNSRVELSLDVMNIGNLLNRNWGMYQSSVYSQRILKVTEMKKVDGGYTPTYSWNGSTKIYDSEFASRWYMQLGARVTF